MRNHENDYKVEWDMIEAEEKARLRQLQKEARSIKREIALLPEEDRP